MVTGEEVECYLGEAGERKESASHGVGRELVRRRTLEPNHALRLGVAVGHVVWVVADVLLRGVGQALVTRCLVRNALGALQYTSFVSRLLWF